VHARGTAAPPRRATSAAAMLSKLTSIAAMLCLCCHPSPSAAAGGWLAHSPKVALSEDGMDATAAGTGMDGWTSACGHPMEGGGRHYVEFILRRDSRYDDDPIRSGKDSAWSSLERPGLRTGAPPLERSLTETPAARWRRVFGCCTATTSPRSTTMRNTPICSHDQHLFLNDPFLFCVSPRALPTRYLKNMKWTQGPPHF
jgi:hypothetical protein